MTNRAYSKKQKKINKLKKNIIVRDKWVNPSY